MYTIRFPFQLEPNKKIQNVPNRFNCMGKEWEILDRIDYYELVGKGFFTKEEALTTFKRIGNAITWMILKEPMEVKFSMQLDEIIEADSDEAAIEYARNFNANYGTKYERLDGIGDILSPSVYLSSKIYRFVGGGAVTVSTGIDVNRVIELLCEGLQFDLSIESDKQFAIALDLYNSHFAENNLNSKFITLITVLEAIATPTIKWEGVVDFINEAIERIHTLKSEFSVDSDEYQEWQELENELDFRKRKSILKTLRGFIRDILMYAEYNNERIFEIQKKVSGWYSKRSKLVHQGIIPEDISLIVHELQQVVELVLTTYFKKSANHS